MRMTRKRSKMKTLTPKLAASFAGNATARKRSVWTRKTWSSLMNNLANAPSPRPR